MAEKRKPVSLYESRDDAIPEIKETAPVSNKVFTSILSTFSWRQEGISISLITYISSHGIDQVLHGDGFELRMRYHCWEMMKKWKWLDVSMSEFGMTMVNAQEVHIFGASERYKLSATFSVVIHAPSCHDAAALPALLVLRDEKPLVRE